MNNDITIGFDLGSKKHKVVGLDVCGKIILKCELSNDKETLGAFFNEHAGATVAMETGTHCRWISSLAKRCGCDAMVGNARKLRAIWESSQKNDWKIQDYADVHFKEDVALLRTVPGVGPVTSCAYAAFAPDPKKFGNPRDAGCYFGLTAFAGTQGHRSPSSTMA